MDIEVETTLRVRLTALYLGNDAAVDLALMIFEVAQVWDDLIDRDHPISDESINRAFRYLIYDIPMNPIMSKELTVILLSCYNQWTAANSIEKCGEDLHKSYMLRASIYQIFQHIAAIVGGLDYGTKVSVDIFNLYGETFESYEEEFKHA